MKRIIIFSIALLFHFSGYSEVNKFSNIDFQVDNTNGFEKSNATYIILHDCNIIDGTGAEIAEIKKNEKLETDGIIYTVDNLIFAGKKGHWIASNFIKIKDSDPLPDYMLYKNLNNKIIWISDWYEDVIQLSHKDAISYINKKMPATKDLYFVDSDSYWYEEFSSYPFGIDFTNVLLNIRFLGRSGYQFLIKDIKKHNSDYIITCFSTDKYDWSDISEKSIEFENFPDPFAEIKLKISPSNNSIKIYNLQNGKLIFSLIPVSNQWVELFQKFLKTGIKDEMLFKTQDFRNEVNVFKVTSNILSTKTMTVRENLKLRSGEATSTQVIATMQAGTRVKILELGKAETIDGISSNWVKVEVLPGAKDKDGNPIRAGTTGWCYGGYLE